MTVARLDREWNVIPGTERRLECESAAVGWGFVARLELALQAGCATVPARTAPPPWPSTASGRTTVPGRPRRRRAHRRRRRRPGPARGRGRRHGGRGGRRGARTAARRTPPSPRAGRGSKPSPARCTERTRCGTAGPGGWRTTPSSAGARRCRPRAVDEAVADLGASDARTVKLLTRAGMGWCQGRMCGEAVARLAAARAGQSLDPYADLLAGAARPVAVPVPLGVLADDPNTLWRHRMSSSPSTSPTTLPATDAESRRRPWRGVLVATALPMRPTGPGGRLAARPRRLCRARALAGGERLRRGDPQRLPRRVPDAGARRARDVVRTAVARRRGPVVMPGVAAYGADEARRWAEQAAQAGAACVMLLPPNAYRARRARGGRALPRGRQGRSADRRVQQPLRHQGRPDPGAARPAVRRGADRRRQGVQRGRPARVRDRRARPRARPARRLRRRRPRARARRARWAGWPATPTRSPTPACGCGGLHGTATSPPRCRCTAPCTRCCAGTPGPSSSRRSSCRWISPAATAGPSRHPRLPLLPEQEAVVREATQKALAEGLR